MANLLERVNVIPDPDSSIYSQDVLGINNQLTYIDENNPTALTNIWFLGYSQILNRNISNWSSSLDISEIRIDSDKVGYVTHPNLGRILFAPDIYDIYEVDWWRFNYSMRNRDIRLENKYPQTLFASLITASITGTDYDFLGSQYGSPGVPIWIFHEDHGWMFFNRNSVGWQSDKFNNTGISGHVSGEGIVCMSTEKMTGGPIRIFNNQSEVSILHAAPVLDENNNVIESPNFLSEMDDFAIVEINGKDYFVTNFISNDELEILNYDGPDVNYEAAIFKKTIFYLISNGSNVYVKKLNKPWQLF